MQRLIGLASVVLTLGVPQLSTHAGLIVGDGFDYSAGLLRPNNGGDGDWTTPWEIGRGTFGYNRPSYPVTTSGLTYSNAGGTLQTSGGAILTNMSPERADSRDWDASGRFDDGAEVWFSALMNVGYGRDFRLYFATPDNGGDLLNGLGLAMFSGNLVLRTIINGNDQSVSGGNIADNQTHLVVGRMAFSDTMDDMFTLWVDPELGTTPNIADGHSLSRSVSIPETWGSVLVRNANQGGSQIDTLDELRIGTDFASVTPLQGQAAAVPEPSSVMLFGLGAAIMAAAVSRRRRDPKVS